MKSLRWLLAIPLLVVGLLMGFSTLPAQKKVGFSDLLRSIESAFKLENNLYLKLRQVKLSRLILNKKIVAMFAWIKKVEDKKFALVGGAGIFVSEELPVI